MPETVFQESDASALRFLKIRLSITWLKCYLKQISNFSVPVQFWFIVFICFIYFIRDCVMLPVSATPCLIYLSSSGLHIVVNWVIIHYWLFNFIILVKMLFILWFSIMGKLHSKSARINWVAIYIHAISIGNMSRFSLDFHFIWR